MSYQLSGAAHLYLQEFKKVETGKDSISGEENMLKGGERQGSGTLKIWLCLPEIIRQGLY